MTTDVQTLQIELEDVGGTSWWAGVLAAVAGPPGAALLRFVARTDRGRRYTSPTFSAPRTMGALPPRPEWAPEMARCLDALRRDLQRDGWREVGRGSGDWAYRYERNRPE